MFKFQVKSGIVVVSAAGFDDGSYDCKLGFNEDDELIFVRVTFI